MSAFIALGEPGQALGPTRTPLPAARLPGQQLLHARLLMLAGLDDARAELSLLVAASPRMSRCSSTSRSSRGSRAAPPNGGRRSSAWWPRTPVPPGLRGVGDLALEAGDAGGSGRIVRTGDREGTRAASWRSWARARSRSAGNADETAGSLTGPSRRTRRGRSPTWTRQGAPVARQRGGRPRRSHAGDRARSGVPLDVRGPGRVHAQAGRVEEAIGDFTAAIRLDPSMFAAYAPRAELLYRADRRAEAVTDYGRVLDLRPDYWYAHAPLGVLLYGEGSWVRAHDELLAAYERRTGRSTRGRCSPHSRCAGGGMRARRTRSCRRCCPASTGPRGTGTWPAACSTFLSRGIGS